MGISTIAAVASAVAAVGGTAYSIATAPSQPKIAPPPQASKTPDAANVRDQLKGPGQGGGAPGVAQNFLTGTGGVDPSLLQLGKSTLLGGG